jgi:protein gp37
MGANTKIEWATDTFNPWIGCEKISAGCANCYAEGVARRFGLAQWGAGAARRVTCDQYWQQPLAWEKSAPENGRRRRVFCGSMCDVMEDRHELQDVRWRLFGLIERTPHLDWLLVTKRPQNFRRFLPGAWRRDPLHNLWLLTTVESRDVLWRIDALLRTPAVVHGLSMEPLLGAAPDIRPWLKDLSWVIVGGESGPAARPMHPEGPRAIRDWCVDANVPFWFKQWGEHRPICGVAAAELDPDCRKAIKGKPVAVEMSGAWRVEPFREELDWPMSPTAWLMDRVGKEEAGCELDGREWKQLPEVKYAGV